MAHTQDEERNAHNAFLSLLKNTFIKKNPYKTRASGALDIFDKTSSVAIVGIKAAVITDTGEISNRVPTAIRKRVIFSAIKSCGTLKI